MIFFANALIVESAVLLIFMAIIGFRQRRLSSVIFFATAGYAIVALANAENLINQFDEGTYLQMSLIYVVCSIVLSISVLVFSGRVRGGGLSLPLWNQSDFHRHATFATTLALASLVIIIAARGENISLNWSEARASNGVLAVLATFLFMLSSPGIVSAFYAKRPTLGVILLLLCLGLFIIMGSRAAFLGVLFLGAWLMLTRTRGLFARLRVVAVALVTVFTVHTLLRSLRSFGIAGLAKAFNEGALLSTLLLSVDENSDLSGGETEIPKYLMFSITQSSIHDFGFMTSIQRLLLLPIPSIEGWVSKPTDVTSNLWKKAFELGLFDNAQGQETLLESYMTGNFGSLQPTIFGEYFLAGEWAALVLSTALLGLVLVAIDLFMHRADRLTSLALCGPILVGYLFVARGNSVVGLGYFVYLSVLVVILLYAVNRVKRWCAFASNHSYSSTEVARNGK